ncbi:MAG: hypothetical protein NVSMB3_02010 [Acidobacteriaceae bacterium]
MKLALALLLLAAPLVAQTPTEKKIVFNVVVTLVKGGVPQPTSPTAPISAPAPVPSPVIVPIPSPVAITTPAPVPAPVPAPPSLACVSYYPDAVRSMNDVSTALLQAQRIYSTALAQHSIDASTYNAGTNALSTVRLDNSGVRDMIRIAGPADVIAQNITFVTAEVGTFPGLLGKTPQLQSSLGPLVASMQASLGTAGNLVATTTCAQALP